MNVIRAILIATTFFSGLSEGVCSGQTSDDSTSISTSSARGSINASETISKERQPTPILPKDLWPLILSKAEPKHRPALRLVCKTFRDIIDARGHVKIAKFRNPQELLVALEVLRALENLVSIDLNNGHASIIFDRLINQEYLAKARESFCVLTKKNTGLLRLNLRHFLSTIKFPLDANAVKDIFAPLTKLKSLDLGYNYEIRVDTLRTIVECCPQLEDLDLTQCVRLTGDTFLKLLESHSARWVHLSLNNKECNAFDLEDICPLISKMPRLKSLSLHPNQIHQDAFYGGDFELEIEGNGADRLIRPSLFTYVKHRIMDTHQPSCFQKAEDGLSLKTIKTLVNSGFILQSLTLIPTLYASEELFPICNSSPSLKKLIIMDGINKNPVKSVDYIYMLTKSVFDHLPVLESLVLRDNISYFREEFWTHVGGHTKSLDLTDASGFNFNKLYQALLGSELNELLLSEQSEITAEEVTYLREEFPKKTIAVAPRK